MALLTAGLVPVLLGAVDVEQFCQGANVKVVYGNSFQGTGAYDADEFAAAKLVACSRFENADPPTYIEFALQTKDYNYGAIGISPTNDPNTKMQNADIMWVGENGGVLGVVELFSTYATSNPTRMADQSGIFDAEVLTTDGATAAGGVKGQWKRKLTSTDPQFLDVTADSELLLIYAYKNCDAQVGTSGTTQLSGDCYHSENAGFYVGWPSQLSAAPSKTGAFMAHGLCMVLAWVLCSPIAVTTARYAKKALPAGRWFKIHMYTQILCLIFTVAGIVIAFNTGTLFQNVAGPMGAHAKLGVTTLALVAFQVLIGLGRNVISDHKATDPEGSHGERRWLFNYMHWTAGLFATALSLATVGLGVSNRYAPLQVPTEAPAVFFAFIGIVFAACLYLEMGFRNESFEKDSSSVRTAHKIIVATCFAAAIALCVLIYMGNDGH